MLRVPGFTRHFAEDNFPNFPALSDSYSDSLEILGPAMPYKQKLQGYEIADVSNTYKFVNNQIIWH